MLGNGPLYFKPSNTPSNDTGDSNSGNQASKAHPMELGISQQQSLPITKCNVVVNDESGDSGDVTVNYVPSDLDGPTQ